jgi:hypothetical protein
MPQAWRTWLFLLGGCLGLAGCLPGSCFKRSQDPGCNLDKLAAAYALQEGEIVLTPEQVQRNAVVGSGLGKALENEADGRDGHVCLACLPSRKRARLARILKAYAADEARNQTAGLALTAYYRLAEARLQIRLVREGLDIAEGVVARAEEMKRRGIALPEDLTKLQRQRIEAADDGLKLELLRDRLTEQIRRLADGKLCAERIGTIEVFHVVDEPLDEGQEIALALKYRPDINGLRAALANLDASTLPLIRQLLGGFHPLLGEKIRRCVPLMECLPRVLPLLVRGEMEKVRNELKTMICERERQAASEVRQAIRKIQTEVQLAGSAREREALAAKRVAELEEMAGKGLATDGDLPRARRDLVKARGEVLHEAIEWEIARVELRQAKGLLVREVLGDGCDCDEPRTK